jgi:hypothetical protein
MLSKEYVLVITDSIFKKKADDVLLICFNGWRLIQKNASHLSRWKSSSTPRMMRRRKVGNHNAK